MERVCVPNAKGFCCEQADSKDHESSATSRFSFVAVVRAFLRVGCASRHQHVPICSKKWRSYGLNHPIWKRLCVMAARVAATYASCGLSGESRGQVLASNMTLLPQNAVRNRSGGNTPGPAHVLDKQACSVIKHPAAHLPCCKAAEKECIGLMPRPCCAECHPEGLGLREHVCRPFNPNCPVRCTEPLRHHGHFRCRKVRPS